MALLPDDTPPLRGDLGTRIVLAMALLCVVPVVTTVFVLTAFAPAILLPFTLSWFFSVVTYDSVAGPAFVLLIIAAQIVAYFALFFWAAGRLLRRLARVSETVRRWSLAGIAAILFGLSWLPIYCVASIGGGACGNWYEAWQLAQLR